MFNKLSDLPNESLLVIAVALQKSGRFFASKTYYQKIINSQTNHPDANHNLGVLLSMNGHGADGIKYLEVALELSPNSDRFLISLVQGYIKNEEYSKAYNLMKSVHNKGLLSRELDLMQKELEKTNYTSESDNSLENADKVYIDLDGLISLYQSKKYKTVLANAKKVPEQARRQSIPYYNICGASYVAVGNYREAIKSYKKALCIDAKSAQIYNNLGVVLRLNGELNEAENSYRKAISIDLNYADPHFNLAKIFHKKGDHGNAIKFYKTAIKLRPNYIEAHNDLANCLLEKGFTNKARKHYERVIDIRPEFAEVHRNLSALIKYDTNHKHFVQMQKLEREGGLGDYQLCNLKFALGKAYEDSNQFDRAFEAYKIGNKLRKKSIQYNIKRDKAFFCKVKNMQNMIRKSAVLSDADDDYPVPLFILGMARSGTTLVEQIISSHSQVFGGGELGLIEDFAHFIYNKPEQQFSQEIKSFREKYLKKINKISGGKGYFTDKMTQNFKHISLIIAAFPEAKIIHVHRNAAATCWSNYKHYFSGEGLGYSYSINDIISFYGMYKDLMSFWHKNYEDKIIDFDYDHLVNAKTAVIKNLISTIGLPWEDICLYPEQNNRTVTTASQLQVRKRIYVDSSKNWLKFKPFLRGAFDNF